MIQNRVLNTLGQNKIQASQAGSRNALNSNTGQSNYRHEATPGGTTGAKITKAQSTSDALNQKDAGKGGDVTTETEKSTVQSAKEGVAVGKAAGTAAGALTSAATTTATAATAAGSTTGAVSGAQAGSNFGAYGAAAGLIIGGVISVLN